MSQHKTIFDRIDWRIISLYLALAIVGIIAIYSVEYRSTDTSIFMPNKNFTKQITWLGISMAVGLLIILLDSSIYTSIPFLSYLIGILLLILVLFIGKNSLGSRSWIYIGSIGFQPGEMVKIFTALALSKFLSLHDVDFQNKPKHRYIAMAIALAPCLLIILSNETGLALAYFSFFLAMYREGLPTIYLTVGFSAIVLTLCTILIPKSTLFIILIIALIAIMYATRSQLKRSREYLIVLLSIFGFCVLFSQLLVPYAFKKVLKAHQIDRIYTMFGKTIPPEYIKEDKEGNKIKTGGSAYNVKQSKIAIGAGGFIGKGFLNGTQTQMNFVPEQRTDFIFCSIGEQFGFVGSLVLIGLYVLLLLHLVKIAERQRSKFTRIYAYCVAGILFFHLFINIGMTIGIIPVIGIPLPLISYGGTSLLTFSVLIFILIRLDADRQMAMR